MSTFPNVPNVPGVPPVLRNPLARADASVTLLRQDSLDTRIDPNAVQWGIFDSNGNAVIAADSTLSVSYKQAWQVSSFSVEPNAFASYDKVNSPYETRVVFSCGGNENDRTAFLQSIEAVADTTDLYDVVTPERTYASANITQYSYERQDIKGLGLMMVEIALLQIRVAVAPAFTSTKTPAGAATTSTGVVQALPATASQANSAAH